jgi:hypothetical protein
MPDMPVYICTVLILALFKAFKNCAFYLKEDEIEFKDILP